jgi:hypothetical protein
MSTLHSPTARRLDRLDEQVRELPALLLEMARPASPQNSGIAHRQLASGLGCKPPPTAPCSGTSITSSLRCRGSAVGVFRP